MMRDFAVKKPYTFAFYMFAVGFSTYGIVSGDLWLFIVFFFVAFQVWIDKKLEDTK